MISLSPPLLRSIKLIEAGKAGALSHDLKWKKPYAHEARLLFLSVLDEEWPELKHSLFRRCWPLFRAACQAACQQLAPWALGRPISNIGEILPLMRELPASALVAPVETPEGYFFVLPTELSDLRHLHVSGDFDDLRTEFYAWSEDAGRGIGDEWLLETSFHTLRTVAPASKDDDYDGSGHAWRYPFEKTFPHRWAPPAPLIDASAPPRVIRKALRDYNRAKAGRFEVPKDISPEHARWTVARLSDPELSWAGLVKRFQDLKRYIDGVHEAKRRVGRFAKWIDLTLAETLAAKDKKQSKTS